MGERFRILAALLVLALGGCNERTEQPKTYVHAMDQAATTTDPARAATIYDSFLVTNVYDTLYRYRYLARPYALAPNLAIAMPSVSENRRVYTIELKPGVRFVDHPSFPKGRGREVTAEDVVYSLARHFLPETRSQGAWLWRDRIVGLDAWAAEGGQPDAEIAGLRAVDRHTVRIELVEPYPQLTHTLATAFSAIVPREAVDALGESFGREPVGSGPFVLERFDEARAVLRANSDFREEPVDLALEGFDPALHEGLGLERIAGRAPPFLDRLELHFIQEGASRWAALVSGRDVHFALVPGEAVERALAEPGDTSARPTLAGSLRDRFHAATALESAVLFQAFNFDHPALGHHADPLQDRRNRALRCAIVRGFDWGAHRDRIYRGMARVYPGLIPPMLPEFDPSLDAASVTRDVEGARRLLADHGWTADTLPPLAFGVPAGTTQRQIFEQFRAFMGDIGYPPEKIQLRQFSTFGALNQAWKEGRLPIINKGWGLDYPDAENVLQLFYGPNRTPGSNDANFSDPAYDALFEATRSVAPGAERTAAFRRLNRMLIDQCAAIMGLSRTRLMLWDRRAVAFPDRMITGGYYLRFVDVLPALDGA